MSSIQLLGHSTGRLYPWVFHAPKVILGGMCSLSGVSGACIGAKNLTPKNNLTNVMVRSIM